ncbi:hypothetical protein PCC9214_01646 [Planktothrix tepida]|uniref:DUF3153 domain-containing protein n=2 Tax=Planktothrix TaxID=54304 RepID=A0A1J1LLG2_9CYAN|nr:MULTISPECIES: DUF3153 domain-containing protein [Planktothrix]CAD5936607.1 hypothetical protein PCC9214_01646 [Planktothrix tepida]CAD5974931.1 hypothetical protein NO713_04098 [Planktothrix pseudagardhii]CUR33389.1 conserved hypothetical protein [Planktothrix tepida PCC 9214]
MIKIIKQLTLVFCAIFLLSGCVRYDVGVEFQDQTHGQIVQKIQLGEQLTSFSHDVVDEWISTMEQRVKQLKGKTKRLSKQEILVTIPFYNGQDLEKKFNQFFNPAEFKSKKSKKQSHIELPQFSSDFNVKQNNFIFALRNHLSLELDLRSLSLLSTSDNVLISSGNLLELQFVLTTPWGATVINPVSLSDPSGEPLLVNVESNGKQVIWTLKPGEINHLEAMFWVPSPIGIGSVLIILVTALGIYLKSSTYPKIKTEKPLIPTKV